MFHDNSFGARLMDRGSWLMVKDIRLKAHDQIRPYSKIVKAILEYGNIWP